MQKTDMIDRALRRLAHIHPDTIRHESLRALEAVLRENAGGEPMPATPEQKALQAEIRAAFRAPANNLADVLGTTAESVRRVLSEFRSPR